MLYFNIAFLHYHVEPAFSADEEIMMEKLKAYAILENPWR